MGGFFAGIVGALGTLIGGGVAAVSSGIATAAANETIKWFLGLMRLAIAAALFGYLLLFCVESAFGAIASHIASELGGDLQFTHTHRNALIAVMEQHSPGSGYFFIGWFQFAVYLTGADYLFGMFIGCFPAKWVFSRVRFSVTT